MRLACGLYRRSRLGAVGGLLLGCTSLASFRTRQLRKLSVACSVLSGGAILVQQIGSDGDDP